MANCSNAGSADSPVYIGVDLGCSAHTHRPSSAVAVLDANGTLLGAPEHFARAKKLVQVVSRFDRCGVIVCVDAPRSVPDHTEENYAFRSCERAVKKHLDKHAGAFCGATALFIRWYEIENRYFQGFKVIETYPRVMWRRLGLPGKPKEFPKHKPEIWDRVGNLVKGCCQGFSHHQVDAVLCAYTAFCYARGQVDWYGEPGEGLIFVPAPGKSNPVPPEVERVDERFRRFASMAGWQG